MELMFISAGFSLFAHLAWYLRDEIIEVINDGGFISRKRL